ncbi:hypothetical protein NQ317_016379 [Molorchus minor]|uniref:Uncharacterized protein n=1 Tax=Molorchus minor TaxID=1323400 RepID=A0ABQ9JJ30_9CUCU|nr:hypothetical protein NQ317_016379 [Molorchus minor]
MQEEDKKRNDYKSGRQVGLSGREMFSFNPELANDNDMEEGDELFDSTAFQPEEDINEYKEINLDILGQDAQEVDGSGTIALEDRFKHKEHEEAACRMAQQKVPQQYLLMRTSSSKKTWTD